MKEGHEAISPPLVEHLDRCLGCMACVTACPSGVQYDKLLEDARAQIERNFERPPAERAHRRLVFELFTRPGRLRASAPGPRGSPGRSASTASCGARACAAGCPSWPALMALAPDTPLRRSLERLPEHFEARGERRGDRRAAPGLRAARLLRATSTRRRRACSRPRASRCTRRGGRAAAARCRSTRARIREARALAKTTIEELEGYDTVIVNAAGCGSAMKDYGHVLRDEPDWAERAQALLGEGPRRDRVPRRGRAARRRAARRHEHRLPRRLPPRARSGRPHPAARAAARASPSSSSSSRPSGSSAAARPASTTCVKPEPAAELGERKARNLLDTGAEAVAAANPGCALQITAHTERLGAACRAPPDGAAGAVDRLGGAER